MLTYFTYLLPKSYKLKAALMITLAFGSANIIFANAAVHPISPIPQNKKEKSFICDSSNKKSREQIGKALYALGKIGSACLYTQFVRQNIFNSSDADAPNFTEVLRILTKIALIPLLLSTTLRDYTIGKPKLSDQSVKTSTAMKIVKTIDISLFLSAIAGIPLYDSYCTITDSNINILGKIKTLSSSAVTTALLLELANDIYMWTEDKPLQNTNSNNP